MLKNTFTALLMLCAFASYGQVVINELDSDTPSTDELEFIELKSDLPNFSLNGYVIVLYNGSPTSSTGNKSYYALDLDGYSTDDNGLILIGTPLVSPVPDVTFTVSTIQNGQDAVALYYANASDFPDQTPVTATNLVDALVYGNNQPDATTLISVLGVQSQQNEGLNNAVATQSIQRKNDGTYEVKVPTPGAHNDGSGISLNGVAIGTTVTEIGEGDSFNVTFTTQTPTTNNLSFTYTLNNGAFNAADYSANLNVTIPAGSSTATITVSTVNDAADEGDELIRITFGTLPQGYNMLNNNIEIRVVDNDFTTAPWGTPVNPTFGNVLSTAPAGYYAALEGKAGDQLKQAIQDIIANPNVVREHNYGDVTDILNAADQNPANSNQVWLLYSEVGRAKYKFQSTASSIGSWNREHIFPQSRGGFANATSSTPDGINVWLPTDANDIAAGHADAHHLRAEDGPENSSRSNRDYGSDYNGPAGNVGSWHGDVARSVFYMAVRYNQLSIVNGNPADNVMYQLGDLASLLQWNHSDPSDDFELNRNNIIYTWQMNRNPFIDMPALADYIWGAHAGETWFASLSTNQFSANTIKLYPNPANDHFSIVGLTAPTTVEIFNIAGMRLQKLEVGDSNATIDINLPAGLYFVNMTGNGFSDVQKLLVR